MQTQLDEIAKARDEALGKLNDAQSFSGLAGNVFAGWQDAKAVGTWGKAGKEILGQFNQISIKHAAGEDVPSTMLDYKLPNGQSIKLDSGTFEIGAASGSTMPRPGSSTTRR